MPLYCPFCLRKLDKNQDCWNPCEYEAEFALPGFEPLTEKARTEKLLSRSIEHLSYLRKEVKTVIADIDRYETTLKRHR